MFMYQNILLCRQTVLIGNYMSHQQYEISVQCNFNVGDLDEF